MFSLDGEPLIERFELVLVSLRWPGGALRVPLVDEWLELQLAMRHIPDWHDRAIFFAALRELCATVRHRVPDLRWYFLHKLPGLKLRFRVGKPDVDVLDTILTGVASWKFAWLEAVAIGSFFDQAELLAYPYRSDVERLLTYAADCNLMQADEAHGRFETEWADVLVELLGRIGLDTWLAYEALARLRRLRAADFVKSQSIEEPLCNPRGLLAQDMPPFSAGFEASLSLLQGVNLLFNVWGVGGAAQSRILTMACDLTQPQLLSGRR